MKKRLRLSTFTWVILCATILAGLHARTLRFFVRQPQTARATHHITSIRLSGVDDSGSCSWCRTATVAALTDEIERTRPDGSAYVALVTFGTVGRVIFGSVVNEQTKPLMLAALKALPVPSQGFTHPDEAVKAFEGQLATLFSGDPTLQAAWRDGEVGVRAVLLWDGKATLDPGSHATPTDFAREVKTLWQAYATPITSVAIAARRTKPQSQRTDAIAHVHELRIASTDLGDTLAQLRDTHRPVAALAPVVEPVYPPWLIALDAVALFGGVAFAAMTITRRIRTRRRRDRQMTLERFTGEWSFRSGPDAGSFELTDGLRLRFGKSGDRLQRLPASFVMEVGQSGLPQVKAESGDLSISGRRVREGDTTDIGTPCQILVGVAEHPQTVELRRIGRRSHRHLHH
ncbi:MAG: hypothetical protein LAO77_19705 [Acidobacteriia bacterium]|nr:hypothetical protein [Terriglobia bacterium]